METVAVIIGMAGVVTNLSAYLLLSMGRLRANQMRYQWMNVGGTIAILISLVAQFNAPAMILNIAWLTVSVLGLVRIYQMRAGSHDDQ